MVVYRKFLLLIAVLLIASGCASTEPVNIVVKNWDFSLSLPSRWIVKKSNDPGYSYAGYISDLNDVANISIRGIKLTSSMREDTEKWLRDNYIPGKLGTYSEGFSWEITKEKASEVSVTGLSGKMIEMLWQRSDGTVPRNVAFIYFINGNDLIIFFVSNRGWESSLQESINTILAGLKFF